MSKTIPAALQAHYDTGSTCVAHAILIERADGAVFGFTEHDEPFTMDVSAWTDAYINFTFDAKQGLSVSNILSSSGFNNDSLEITTLDDGSLFDRDQVLAGVWRDAKFRIFRYRWDVATPTVEDDIETLVRGWLGQFKLNLSTIAVELFDLKQKLQQSIVVAGSPTCRVRLGSVGDAKCNKDLAAFTHALTVTSVVDKQTFTASAAVQASDYFGEGTVAWATGDNAPVSQKVRAFESGAFTLVLPMVFDIQVGDTFTAIAGCRKRVGDCRDKFDNIPNMQAEPYRPSMDQLVTSL